MKRALIEIGPVVFAALEIVEPDESYLLGTAYILDVAHHVNAIRVNDEGEYDGRNTQWKSLLDDFYHAYEQPWQTVEFTGFKGRYVLLIHPHGE